MKYTWCIPLGSRCKVSIFFFPMLAAAIWGGYAPLFCISYLCALIHELSHVWAALHLRIGIAWVEIQPFGLCARLKEQIIRNPKKEIVIALAGPGSNLVIMGILLYFRNLFSVSNPLLSYAIYCNAALCLMNLIPTLPLDGGRILRAILTLETGALAAYNFMIRLSRVLVLGILAAAVALLLVSRFQFSLILIGVFLLANLCSEQKNISLQSLREILYYQDKLAQGELNTTHTVSAYGSTPARRVLRRLSYHSYSVVHVLDQNRRITKTLTESQILDALLNRGIRVTLDEV